MTNHPCLPGTEGLPGHETFSVKIRTVSGKLNKSPYFSCSLGLPSLDLGSSITIAHFLIAQKTLCFWYLQKKNENYCNHFPDEDPVAQRSNLPKVSVGYRDLGLEPRSKAGLHNLTFNHSPAWPEAFCYVGRKKAREDFAILFAA